MARLFCACELPTAVVALLGAWQAEVAPSLRGGAGPPARAEPPGRLHLTVAFLGETDGALVARLGGALVAAARAVDGPVRLGLTGRVTPFGGAPGPAGATALAVPVDDPTGRLASLHADLEARLAEVARPSFRPDPRPYSPHVTVFRRPRSPTAWPGERGPGPVAFTARSLALVRSDPGPDGPRYTVLARARLDSPPDPTTTNPFPAAAPAAAGGLR